MDVERVAPWVGILGCLAALAALTAPFALVDAPGADLGAYYAAGTVGGGGLAFLAVLSIVVFLAGQRGRADPTTAAGVVVVLGAAMVGVAALWATSIDPTLLYSFPPSAAWLEYHRWVVVALAAVVAVAAGAYANATV